MSFKIITLVLKHTLPTRWKPLNSVQGVVPIKCPQNLACSVLQVIQISESFASKWLLELAEQVQIWRADVGTH